MRRLLREPLLHFFILGGVLFLLYGAWGGDTAHAPERILVDASRQRELVTQFEQAWGRAPDAPERQRLVDAWVREEVLYREGVAAGLEQDDVVVRRRVVQKAAMMLEGMATPSAPAEADLQAWLAAHPERYQAPARYSVRQVYFDPARHRDGGAAVAAALARLRSEPPGDAVPGGDPSQLPAVLAGVPPEEIARVFGAAFAAQLATLRPGQWQGPVRSAYGLHLVRVDAVQPQRLQALAEVRAEVERDLTRQRAEQAVEAMYRQVRGRYTVVVAEAADAPASPAAGDAGRARP